MDDIIYIRYFDRQRAIQCSGFKFVQDLPRFLFLLLAMQRFTGGRWCLNEMFESTKTEMDFPSDDFGVTDLLFNMDPAVCTNHFGLCGRATNVLPVTSEALFNQAPFPDGHITGDEYVAKIFWAEELRKSEPSIIQKARVAEEERVRGHIPEPVRWGQFADTSIATIREELGVGPVPEGLDRSAEPRDNIQEGNPADAKVASRKESVPGSRVLRIIVFRELRPITDLSGRDLLRAWWEIALCHYELWKRGIHHRDISESNLVYYRNAQGVAVGVLNGFDLSSTTKGRQGDERIGTVPFMAIELLDHRGFKGHITHQYRHDAESLVWVLAWVTLHYQDGTPLPRGDRPLDACLSLQAHGCAVEKVWFMLRGRHGIVPPRSQKQNWKVVLRSLKILVELHNQDGDGDEHEDEHEHEDEDEYEPVVLTVDEVFEKLLHHKLVRRFAR
ncbi:hypothetical protein BV22DRAFT_892934 [Leucogyrophana mollusca]|uniref:Uncharacterized protein n=1 Tax=Leucogyrophana mollusca TaxID=85980 RepID=A0ACB8B0F5_9AGAM|nr:hypothetical protein BV22DRAFT_892934 [Leucogyrophana mollusca]